MKRYKLIACKLLQREIAAAMLGTENYIDLSFLRQELHSTPALLHDALQREIDAVENGTELHSNAYVQKEYTRMPDAILLGYGLCSNAVVGLHSSRTPLVIPRAHDCTTLLMGSKEAYSEYFNTVKGTSFLSRGWLEQGFRAEERDMEKLRQIYMEKYEDEDAVEFLLEMEKNTMPHYTSLTGIFWQELERETLEREGRKMAAEQGWEFRPYEGSSLLLRQFLDGDWPEDRFLVVQPGESVQPSYDRGIICAEKLPE